MNTAGLKNMTDKAAVFIDGDYLEKITAAAGNFRIDFNKAMSQLLPIARTLPYQITRKKQR